VSHDIPGQKLVWQKVRELWLKKCNAWLKITNIGQITGCGIIELKDKTGKILRGAFWILVSKSTHFFWKLQCTRIHDRKPEDEWPKEIEIHNWWLAAINAQLTLDRSMTNWKYGKKAIKQEIVLSTWKRLLKKTSCPKTGSKHMEFWWASTKWSILDNPDNPPWWKKSHTLSGHWFLRWFSLYGPLSPLEVLIPLHSHHNVQVPNLVNHDVIKLIQKERKIGKEFCTQKHHLNF
jgi:hypothetical protein